MKLKVMAHGSLVEVWVQLGPVANGLVGLLRWSLHLRSRVHIESACIIYTCECIGMQRGHDDDIDKCHEDKDDDKEDGDDSFLGLADSWRAQAAKIFL